MLKIFWLILKMLVILAFIFIVALTISFISFYIYFHLIKKMDLPKNINRYTKESFFKKIFYDFPKIFWMDKFNAIPRRISRVWVAFSLSENKEAGKALL